MAKKNKMVIIFILIIAIVAIAYFTAGKEIFVGENDKGVQLKVFAFDENMQPLGELQIVKDGQLFATVEYGPPGTPLEGVSFIQIQHTITVPPFQANVSEVPVDVQDLIATFTSDGSGDLGANGDTRYETAIATLAQTYSIPLGGQQGPDTSDLIAVEDLTDDCNDAPYCEFKLQMDATFQDVDPDTGQEITTAIPAAESFGTVIIKVSGDVCTDGTPWGQCSTTIYGQYCDGGNLVDCAAPTGCPVNPTGCACDTGDLETNEDAICSPPQCIGGQAPGECTGTDALRCDPTCTQEDCGAAIQDCYECGQAGQDAGTPLGWVDTITNAAECPLAYNGDPADSCHDIQHTCKYKGKKPKVNAALAGS